MGNKHNNTRPARDAAVEQLLRTLEENGSLSNWHYLSAAEECGYSTRHLRRLVNNALHGGNVDPSKEAGNRFVVDEDVVEAVMFANGNIAKSRRLLKKKGVLVPPLRSYHRYVHHQLGAQLRAAAKDGPRRLRATQVYLTRDHETRGYTYMLDHTELPIWVVPNGYKTPKRPWITAVMDAETRYVLAFVLTFGTPSAEQVRAALISAFIQRSAADGQTVVGGLPVRCMWDRGLDFLSDLITESCIRVGTTPTPLPGYSPHLKGAIERFWDFLKEDALGHLPGYIDAGHGVDDKPVFDNAALDEDTFFQTVEEWVEGYNAEHVHSALGRTPLEAWAADPTPVEHIAFEDLWFGFLLGKDAKVSSKGIRHATVDYTDLDGIIARHIGEKLEIRYLPHDRTFIEVFKDGSHLATCYPTSRLTPDQQLQFHQSRTAARREAQRAFTRARRLRAQTPGAIKIDRVRGTNGKTIPQVVVPEPDLFQGVDDALAGYLPDTDQDGLF